MGYQYISISAAPLALPRQGPGRRTTDRRCPLNISLLPPPFLLAGSNLEVVQRALSPGTSDVAELSVCARGILHETACTHLAQTIGLCPSALFLSATFKTFYALQLVQARGDNWPQS